MPLDANGFLEYLQLQGGDDPELITKSELIAIVRSHGDSISDRQLTFYVSEGLIPKSVRVGTRAGAYPKIVAELLSWILRSRDSGVPIEAIKELLPVWKLLVRSRREHRLDLAELEYVARQHVETLEGSLAIVTVIGDVLGGYCPGCRGDIKVLFKDGTQRSIDDVETTIGFSVAQRSEDEEGKASLRWFGHARMSLARVADPLSDPTTLLLGVRPNDPLPPTMAAAAGHGREPHRTTARTE